MRKETEKKTFVIIKNDERGRPKFYINNQSFGMLSGLIKNIQTEKKEIVPTKGDNMGKNITVYNLLIDMIDLEGEVQLQVPLYTGLARNIMNALAGPEELDEIFFSVYNNKKGFRAISVRHSEAKEDYVVPLYNRDQELAMTEIKMEKGEEKKDFDKLTQKYINEMLPIILKKIGAGVDHEKGATVPLEAPATEDDEDTIPF